MSPRIEDSGSQTRRRVALVLAQALAVFALLLGALPLQGVAAAQQPPASCGFALGFAQLKSVVSETAGADVVGACQENEYHAPNGDGVQLTTGGLLTWRKATNWTAFTDGRDSWVTGPAGVQKRANSERLPWEPASGPDPVAFLSTASTALSTPIEVDESIRQVLVLHKANEGSTFNRYFGDLGGKKLYAVSLYPDRGKVVAGKEPALDTLRSFVLANGDLLSDPRVSIGTWYSEKDGKSYVDVSATLADRAQAVELGKRYNQISIFDLSSYEEIETGGTGAAVSNLPPVGSRLPPMESRRQ